MLSNKTILVVVPARGESKGIKMKNIYPLCGKPLIAYTGEVVNALSYVDRAVVSTDNEKIAEAAKACGLDVPFFRPESLSGDRIGDLEILTHALLEMEHQDDRQYDVIVMLQPTSPMRKPDHVTNAVSKLIDGDFDSVWTLSPTDSKDHPLKQLIIRDDLFDYYDPEGANIIARQQLSPVFHRNGVAYAISRQCLLEQKSIKGKRSGAVVINDPVANIDTEFDIRLAEFLMRQR